MSVGELIDRELEELEEEELEVVDAAELSPFPELPPPGR